VFNTVKTFLGFKKMNKAIAKRLPKDSVLKRGKSLEPADRERVLREERLTKRVAALLAVVVSLAAAAGLDLPLDAGTIGLLASVVVGGLGVRWEYNSLRTCHEAGFSDTDT